MRNNDEVDLISSYISFLSFCETIIKILQRVNKRGASLIKISARFRHQTSHPIYELSRFSPCDYQLSLLVWIITGPRLLFRSSKFVYTNQLFIIHFLFISGCTTDPRTHARTIAACTWPMIAPYIFYYSLAFLRWHVSIKNSAGNVRLGLNNNNSALKLQIPFLHEIVTKISCCMKFCWYKLKKIRTEKM